MLRRQTLRKAQPVQFVLLHGLFSNGAFWIPYLRHLDGFQLTLLSVDFAVILDEEGAFEETAERIDGIVREKPTHVITHSFGAWLGLRLRAPTLSRAFICPTFAALAFDAESFRAEIQARTAILGDDIATLVGHAMMYKREHADMLGLRQSDTAYLPDRDPYFRYQDRMAEGQTCLFRGGHFNVEAAVSMIAASLPAR